MKSAKFFNILTALMLPLALSAQPKMVTLDECLASAERNDMSVRNAHLDLLGAKEVRKEAMWGYFPNVSLAGWGYGAISPLIKVTSRDVLGNSDAASVLNGEITSYAYENGIKPYYETARYGYGVGIGAVQPVYMGGIIVNGNRLARVGEKTAEVVEQIRIRDLRDSIECKYWRIVALQEKEKTLEYAARLLDEVEREVSGAAGAGLATESDLLGVRLRRKELEAGCIELRNGSTLLKMDLFNTAGIPYSYVSLKDIVLCGSLDTLASPAELFGEADGSADLDESRLLALKVESAQISKRLEMGKLKPQVMLGAGYGYNDMLGQNRPKLNGVAYATVRIPLSSLGKIGILSRKMDYQIEKARNEQDFYGSQLEVKFKMGRLSVETAWEQLNVAREAVAVAGDALRHIQSNFKAGMATSAELMQAEYAFRGEKEKMIDRLNGYRNAVSGYRRLIGH